MIKSSDTAEIQQLSTRFRRMATSQFRGYTPLYEQLALAIADDPEMLQLAHVQRARAVAPLLFLGAVHYVLLNEPDAPQNPLAAFYPSISPDPKPPKNVYPHFRAFCFDHRDEIRYLLDTRSVQTNEVQRCTSLLPGFEAAARASGDKPLAILEVGASAGFNLLWDLYGYDYGPAGSAGDPNSPLQLRTEVHGENYPPLPAQMRPVVYRAGIELNPIDVSDPQQVRWLRALIWPEHRERAELMQKAVDLAQEHSPRLIAGDVFDLLPGVLEEVPQETTLCIFHSYTIVQFPPEKREHFSTMLAEAGAKRDFYRIALEWLGEEHSRLEITTYKGGREEQTVLANCQPHGRWIEWLRRDA